MTNDPQPPDNVTPETFAQWRSPRRGTGNPERLTNPYWQWMIRSRATAYRANKIFDGPSPFQAGPGWCFDRFGPSTSQLSDGRTLLIAGEHEDYYDPDFYIYNDLVVMYPSGEIDIYGYPTELFPPTDFHSATLLDDRIVLVGSLGYPKDRRIGETQVLTLDCRSYAVALVKTTGACPGWLHGHQAELTDDGTSILITGGKLVRSNDEQLVENIDDWKLQLSDWRWQRLTDRRWVRFTVSRADRKRNHFFEFRSLAWHSSTDWSKYPDRLRQYEADEAKLQAEIGTPLRLDLMSSLYTPPIPHEVLPENEDEYGVYRIRVEGTVVRYVESSYDVQVTVEGDLPSEMVHTLQQDLIQKLAQLENAPMTWRAIVPA